MGHHKQLPYSHVIQCIERPVACANTSCRSPSHSLSAKMLTAGQVDSCRHAVSLISDAREGSMAADWLQTLEEQGAIARSLISNVDKVLVRDDLSPDQVRALYRIIGKRAEEVSQLLAPLSTADLHPAFREAGDALQDIYGMLLSAIVEKLRAIHGLRLVSEPA